MAGRKANHLEAELGLARSHVKDLFYTNDKVGTVSEYIAWSLYLDALELSARLKPKE